MNSVIYNIRLPPELTDQGLIYIHTYKRSCDHGFSYKVITIIQTNAHSISVRIYKNVENRKIAQHQLEHCYHMLNHILKTGTNVTYL